MSYVAFYPPFLEIVEKEGGVKSHVPLFFLEIVEKEGGVKSLHVGGGGKSHRTQVISNKGGKTTRMCFFLAPQAKILRVCHSKMLQKCNFRVQKRCETAQNFPPAARKFDLS